MPSKRPGVVLVSRCFVRNNRDLLIIKRAPSDRHNPDMWECPGGKLDEAEDLTGSLQREVYEETNLVVTPTYPIAHQESVVIPDGPYCGLPYVILFSITDWKDGIVRLSNEHTEFQWVSYKRMFRFDLTCETRTAAKNLRSYLK